MTPHSRNAQRFEPACAGGYPPVVFSVPFKHKRHQIQQQSPDSPMKGVGQKHTRHTRT